MSNQEVYNPPEDAGDNEEQELPRRRQTKRLRISRQGLEERHVQEENEHPTSFGNRQGSDTNLRPLDTENDDEVTEGGGGTMCLWT